MFENATCWINGTITSAAEAKVSVFDHGFLYGDGIFEGIRFYNNKIFRFPRHLKRLQNSAAALQLTIPLSAIELEQAVLALVQASSLTQGYIRIIVTRGVGVLGINPDTCDTSNIIIIADELQMISDEKRDEGARAIIASTRRQSPDRLDPRIKSLNYLNSIMAKVEANHAGVDEAIMLNDRGCVAEGTVDNLFIVKDGKLLTPPTTEGALAGITRETVLELAVKNGITSQEEVMTAYDLYTADECFLTGTGAKLIPVREIDGRTIKSCPGELYKVLSAAFSQLIEEETQ